jgi:FPC/CPF motif-containing protein YcgG
LSDLFQSRDMVVARFGPRDWRSVMMAEFSATLASEERPFPCVFGVQGLQAGHLRFAFPDPLTPHALAEPLREYLAGARNFGANTSLVVMARPGPVLPLEAYRERFWSLLSGLSTIDASPWPSDIPDELDHAQWEFCFAGQPFFVVCATPAHVARQSRRASTFIMTFQPRWVFNKMLETRKSAERAFAKVRARLAPYDLIPAAPSLGHYGDPTNREYAQYFIDDTNESPRCPFAKMPKPKTKEQAA